MAHTPANLLLLLAAHRTRAIQYICGDHRLPICWPRHCAVCATTNLEAAAKPQPDAVLVIAPKPAPDRAVPAHIAKCNYCNCLLTYEDVPTCAP